MATLGIAHSPPLPADQEFAGLSGGRRALIQPGPIKNMNISMRAQLHEEEEGGGGEGDHGNEPLQGQPLLLRFHCGHGCRGFFPQGNHARLELLQLGLSSLQS